MKNLVNGSLLAIFSISLTLLLLEAGLRLFYPGIGALKTIIMHAPGGDTRAYVPSPGSKTLFTGLHERLDPPADWKINAAGFRSDRPLAKKSGKYRVVTFGDSETFGWSVPIVHSFQRRMEETDSRVEVLNLGVPGYNVENVADHMADWLPRLNPDFVIYLFHKNDLDPGLTFTEGFTGSRLYLLYRKSQERIFRSLFPERKKYRHSEERLEQFSAQVRRMADMSGNAKAPFLSAFMDWRFVEAIEPALGRDCDQDGEGEACGPAGTAWTGSVNIEDIRQTYDRPDGHMVDPAHRDIAELFCRIIAAGGEGCVPPGWSRSAMKREAGK